jgi:hypothetical protein
MAATVPRIRAARIKGYEGDSCDECGNFSLLRNGTCLQCDPAAFRSRLPGEGRDLCSAWAPAFAGVTRFCDFSE